MGLIFFRYDRCYMLSVLSYLHVYFGPFRLLQSYAVLMGIALYAGFFFTYGVLPSAYRFLPQDRGRAFAPCAQEAAGKPTGAGVIFVSVFVLLVYLLMRPSFVHALILLLTWGVMLTGYLDDCAQVCWGEYRKGALDFLFAVLTAALLGHFYFHDQVFWWFPFFSDPVFVSPFLFFAGSVVILWMSINATNCTDGVDGLSGALVLMALLSMGTIFYFLLGNVRAAQYLLVPFVVDGAQWALMSFALAGALMGYVWRNAHPSTVLMGDAGSRALGFFIGVLVLISGNPFLLLMTSGVILVNGGTGLLKVVLLRFFHVRILSRARFPLHDHMRENWHWSTAQVLLRFMILQGLLTIGLLGVLFKLR
ncbi:phospho-N-acetylmuramoyl-pentapeptide-transferase [Treponema pallidum]|uniref:phospho-N-acetylmuramoyl-pentapeptide- transferase n=1 Tax=Treponema pallidum TaxID=160 RepID=UPI0033650FA4